MFPLFETTPLQHAIGCGDWVLARWLQQNSADPDFKLAGLGLIYNLSDDVVDEANNTFRDMQRDVKQEKMSIGYIC